MPVLLRLLEGLSFVNTGDGKRAGLLLSLSRDTRGLSGQSRKGEMASDEFSSYFLTAYEQN